jgi:hypothetical protein
VNTKFYLENVKETEYLKDLGVGTIIIIYESNGVCGVDWIYLVRDRDQWLALVNTVKKLIFEVFTAVRMKMLSFWVLTPCRLAGGCKRFGETYCLHLQG